MKRLTALAASAALLLTALLVPSTAGAATGDPWHEVTTLASTTTTGSNWVAVATSADGAKVAALALTSDTEAAVFLSDDYGENWSDPETLFTGRDVVDAPDIAMSADGDVISAVARVVGEAGALATSRTWTAGAWGPVVDVGLADGDTRTVAPSTKVSADGSAILVAYIDEGNDEAKVGRSTNDGASFALTTFDNPFTDESIEIDPSITGGTDLQKATVLWGANDPDEEEPRLFAANTQNQGANWGATQLISAADPAEDGFIVEDVSATSSTDGTRQFLAYSTGTSGVDRIFVADSGNGGASFSAARDAGLSPITKLADPEVASSGDGKDLVLAFRVSRGPSVEDYWIATSHDYGATFPNDREVGRSGVNGGVAYPNLLMGRTSGRVVFAYREFFNPVHKVLTSFSEDSGDSWSDTVIAAEESDVYGPTFLRMAGSIQATSAVLGWGGFESFGGAKKIQTNWFAYPKPGAPTITGATPGNAQAEVAVRPPADTGGLPIVNYEYRIDGGPWMTLNPPQAASPLTISGLTNGQTVSIEVRAVTDAGSGPGSNSVSVTPVAPPTPSPTPTPTTSPTPSPTSTATVPGAPVKPVAKALDKKVEVSWQTPASDGGSAIIDYTATTSNGKSCTTAEFSCKIKGLKNGRSYDVTVAARNAIGTGPTAATKSTVPGPKLVVKARPKNKDLVVGKKNLLVRRTQTRGKIKALKVQCLLDGKPILNRKDRKQLCKINIRKPSTRRAGVQAQAVDFTKVSVTPRCNHGLSVRVRIDSQESGSPLKTWKRRWDAAGSGDPCTLNGNG
ncbi:MAG: hypothetical protein KDC39_05060 [Actinobacteria bacterium]|nr:hypothetical protein [Actinomycetota bacterium]